MLDARNRLRRMGRAGDVGAGHCVYSEKDDSGIGKNILRECDRAAGEAGYTSALRRYAFEVCLLV
jgi:hypothetical protein